MTRRFVFDTGVLISAALMPQSLPRKALDAALVAGVLVMSDATLAELAEVVGREKFERYVSLALRRTFVDELASTAQWVEIATPVVACRDPKDDAFLSLALSAAADCIVTGDEDLLVLHPFRGVPILTPTQFLELLVQR